MSNHNAVALEGSSLRSEEFFARNVVAPFSPQAVLDVLLGKSPICHLKGFFDRNTCSTIRRNFWENPGLRERGDQVAGYVVGAYHYGLSTLDYLHECQATRKHVESLFTGARDPVARLEALLVRAAAPTGRVVRRARHQGMEAARCAATSWSAPGEFLLAPHDDVAQVGAKEQRGFEIQQVARHTVVGVNLYCSMPPVGGELELWNISPNRACRARLGIEERGHPYDVEQLRSFQSMLLAVAPGDCVLLNGGFVHGVRGTGNGVPIALDERRLILTLFVGIKDDETILWWT
ncbi:MAG: hypothetical protein ACOY0T_12785 [Myxococcota bacterium]